MNPKTKTNKPHKDGETDLTFGDLEFEEVLADLLKIKPVDNAELKKNATKKKSKPKTKK